LPHSIGSSFEHSMRQTAAADNAESAWQGCAVNDRLRSE
jgi:hypothetical protein